MSRLVPILAVGLVVAGIFGLLAVNLCPQTQGGFSLSQSYASPLGGMMAGGMGGRGMMGAGMMQNMTLAPHASAGVGGGNYSYAPYADATPVPADKPVDREIKITARNFQFDTTRIPVKQGETVRFVIANQDVILHDFVSTAGRINYTLLPANTTQSIVWVASQKGTYIALCTFHPGMQIQIVVE